MSVEVVPRRQKQHLRLIRGRLLGRTTFKAPTLKPTLIAANMKRKYRISSRTNQIMSYRMVEMLKLTGSDVTHAFKIRGHPQQRDQVPARSVDAIREAFARDVHETILWLCRLGIREKRVVWDHPCELIGDEVYQTVRGRTRLLKDSRDIVTRGWCFGHCATSFFNSCNSRGDVVLDAGVSIRIELQSNLARSTIYLT